MNQKRSGKAEKSKNCTNLKRVSK